ncbi:MAG: serpin family protein [Deltaproteobacteria bacterium]|jgi:serpin B|nr:serpin family protein [Deltaproteobacteria bacterium]
MKIIAPSRLATWLLTALWCAAWLSSAWADDGSAAAPSQEILALAAADAAFGLDLYGQLGRQAGNIFFSPLSVSFALGLLEPGAGGETAAQLSQVLRRPQSGPALAASVAELKKSLLAARGEGLEFALADSLWADERLTLKDSYLQLLRTNFEAEAFNVDFAKNSEGARQRINDWVAQNTLGKIDNLLAKPLAANVRLILIDAVAFKGRWTSPFDSQITADDEFYVGSTKISTPFMSQTHKFPYAEVEGLQLVELPYADEAFSLLIALPADESGALAALEQSLTADKLAQWRKALKAQKVELSLPKFSIVWGAASLREALAALGLTAPFGPQADFGGLADGGLLVDDVLHKAVIELDEEGTEAAAATAVIGVTSIRLEPSPVFRANRPFVFFIQHVPTGSVVFMGRLTDPRG